MMSHWNVLGRVVFVCVLSNIYPPFCARLTRYSHSQTLSCTPLFSQLIFNKQINQTSSIIMIFIRTKLLINKQKKTELHSISDCSGHRKKWIKSNGKHQKDRVIRFLRGQTWYGFQSDECYDQLLCEFLFGIVRWLQLLLNF